MSSPFFHPAMSRALVHLTAARLGEEVPHTVRNLGVAP